MSYITFSKISVGADMGSQLQQYASMYAVAKETNKTIVFPESSLYTGWGLRFPQLIDVDDIYLVDDNDISDFNIIRQRDGLLVDEAVFNLEEDKSYNFDHLFHLYHYWYDKYRDDIFNLRFNEEYYRKAKEIYSTIKKEGKQTVSIHVRRGDYLSHNAFCHLEYDYYDRAMNEYNSDSRFIVFSNDINWCKDNLPKRNDITFLDRNEDCVDLILMSLCDHNIIANSSFSWWAAFFNKNKSKKVVCPTNYIKPIYKEIAFMNGNYYPSEWKNIDNE